MGSLIVAGLGLCDDLLGVGAKRKLLIQCSAAALAYASGLRIDALSLPWMGAISLGWLALPATVVWFCAIVNALNLIDGLDGLAAGVAFFACVTNAVVAFLAHNVATGLLSVTLAGAILGFLFYNFNPARIFMGDSGSMFLGFVLASISLLGSGTQKSPTLIAILVPILALGLPIMDMLWRCSSSSCSGVPSSPQIADTFITDSSSLVSRTVVRYWRSTGSATVHGFGPRGSRW